MTTPIKSAKTAKEMLEAVCEDLEHKAERHLSKVRPPHYIQAAVYFALWGEVNKYRAILKEME